MSEIVATTVLKEGQSYYGVADVLGNSYQAAYSPLKDSNGKIIGIMYVGAPDSNERIASVEKESMINIFIDSIVVLLFVFIGLYFLMRPIIKRLKQSMYTLNEVTEGNLLVDVPKTKSNDEIDNIITATDKLRKQLHNIINQVTTTTNYVNGASEQLVQSVDHTSRASEQISTEIQHVSLGSIKQTESTEAGLVAIKEIAIGMQQTAEVVQSI